MTLLMLFHLEYMKYSVPHKVCSFSFTLPQSFSGETTSNVHLCKGNNLSCV